MDELAKRLVVMDRRASEPRLNVLVGSILSEELGLRAMSEEILSRRKPDVTVFVNGVSIIIEGSYSKTDAESDVEKKLSKGLGDLGVALHYKEEYPSTLTDAEIKEKLKSSIFEVRLMVPEDVSRILMAHLEERRILPRFITDWMEASLTDLTSILYEAVQFILRERDVEESIAKIEEVVNYFVSAMEEIDRNKSVARDLYNILYRLYGFSVGDYKEIDDLLYAQAALIILLSTTFYQSIHSQLGFESILYLTERDGYRLGMREAFKKIYSVDWRRIFGTALEVLDTLPDALSEAFRRLVDLASEISSKRTLLKKDFAGKIYHKIVGDWSIRKNFATYYTTIPAAYLLAYLAVFTRTGVFKDFNRIKIGDLTCGSGTLLVASYNALRDLYIRSRFEKSEEINLDEFHRWMLEEDIWGLDALSYAVQIASTNLALQNPTTSISKMNMYTIPLGKKNERVILGSLEFIGGRSLPSILRHEIENYPFMEDVESGSITGGEHISSEIPEFDFIIMNPPFMRATGRGGKERGGLFGFFIDESVRNDVIEKYDEIRSRIREKQLKPISQRYYSQNSLKELNVDNELYSIGQAGEGLLFLYLASELVKNDGKIAFVLPKSLLTGVSWYLVRCLLLDRFHLEHVVVSYDAEKGYNFSESTSLSEALIVARKRETIDEDEKTKVTILLSKPSTSLEARALALRIVKTVEEDYLEVNGARAYAYEVPRKKLIERLHNWGALLSFTDPDLIKLSDEILSGKLFGREIPMEVFGKIANIGIDRHQFHDLFQKVSGRPPSSYPIIYGGEEERRLYMLTAPNAWAKPKRGKSAKARSTFKDFSSSLLVPDRIRVDTTHITAMYCNEPVLSNIFYAVRLKSNEVNVDKLKALCLWLNTTWGILSILANRSETEGAWINLKMTHWKLLPVLDVMNINEDTLRCLTTVFNRYCRSGLRKLPEQYDPRSIDEARLGIDVEFLKCLGIDVEEEKIRMLYGRIYESLRQWIGGEQSS